MGSRHQLNPTLVFFFIWIFFHFQSVGSSAFQKNGSTNTCIFFAFLKKIATTGSSHFLSPNGQGSCVWHLSILSKNADRCSYNLPFVTTDIWPHLGHQRIPEVLSYDWDDKKNTFFFIPHPRFPFRRFCSLK